MGPRNAAKSRWMSEAGWQVEDGFFGALLGAVLGVIAPTSPPLCFALLLILLAGIVLLINRAGKAPWVGCVSLILSALLLTILGCAGLCVMGFFELKHCLWLAGPISAWALVKLESRIGTRGV